MTLNEKKELGLSFVRPRATNSFDLIQNKPVTAQVGAISKAQK